eukprot:CAMPEP_0171287370 /NCGR_PEP_ID=MMETSP0790-20130122/69510_1 /TAXON_ID=2925 /ORGANISM="Alexandrium catenella, Strain OF101" /LENGTH=186 /DNA_ID=CAMNT_0011756877 /DNA_START=139 /DNA_END=697 /DNA_ORIENTATION=-
MRSFFSAIFMDPSSGVVTVKPLEVAGQRRQRVALPHGLLDHQGAGRAHHPKSCHRNDIPQNVDAKPWAEGLPRGVDLLDAARAFLVLGHLRVAGLRAIDDGGLREAREQDAPRDSSEGCVEVVGGAKAQKLRAGCNRRVDATSPAAAEALGEDLAVELPRPRRGICGAQSEAVPHGRHGEHHGGAA